MERPPCPLDTARFIVSAEQAINRLGIAVEVCTDFAELRRSCAWLHGKGATSAPFSNLFCDIMPAQGLWVRGLDAGGTVVHIQALRCDWMEGVSLDEFWAQHLRRIHCDPNPGTRYAGASPAARRITGKVVYQGEMWIARRLRGRGLRLAKRLPGSGLASLLVQFGMALAYARWSPDFVYALVDAKLVAAGFPQAGGYMHVEPEGQIWDPPPPGIRADDYLCWNHRQDLAALIRQPAERETFRRRLHG